jgi:integrase
MAIYKRGGFYWFEFVFKGKRYQQSTKLTNQNDARSAAAAYRTKLAKGEFGIEDPEPVPTLLKFSVDFMKQIRMDCASKPRTIAFYEEKLKRLLLYPKLAGAPLDRIDEDLIEAYKRVRSTSQSRRKKLVSPASINRELATLRRLLRMACAWKRIPSVPKIKLLRGETAREFVLSRDDEPRYLDALPADMRPICTFLIDTGLRVGEALKMEWPQVNLREQPGYLTVRAGQAKSSKRRTVPLTLRARKVLEAIAGRKGIVFRNSEGEPLYHTWLDQQQAELRKLLGFPQDFVLHSLRHTFGTRLGETGADAFTIMKLMGHSSVTVSQKYVHPSTEAMQLAIERMGGDFGVPTKSPTGLRVVKAKKRVSGK